MNVPYLERLHSIWDAIDDLLYNVDTGAYPGITPLTLVRDLRKEVSHGLDRDELINAFFKEYR